MKLNRFLITLLLISINAAAWAQWINRYPLVDGYSHHTYLEAFELPILNAGPTDSAPSPDNQSIAFAAKGWLWTINLNDRIAKRITASPYVDSRPNWSNDGKKIVFIRDTGKDTQIMLLNLDTKEEIILINSPKLELDPIFSNDDKHVYYSSAVNGSLDIWKFNLHTKERLTVKKGLGVNRLPIPNKVETELIYLKKHRSIQTYELLNLNTQTSKTIIVGDLLSQGSFALAPNNQTLVYTYPYKSDYELRLTNITAPGSTLLLTKSKGLPLNPKFTQDGTWIYYTESDDTQRHELKRIRTVGGNPETIKINTWQWGLPTNKVVIKTLIKGHKAPVRLNIIDQYGHPYIPEKGLVHSDGESGKVFFYSAGEIELTLPFGNFKITASQGFSTISVEKEIEVAANSTNQIELNLEQIWDAKAAGWYAGDNHFHLNYGGAVKIAPNDIIAEMNGEGIDIGFPVLANLSNRFIEKEFIGWKKESVPILMFGQEIRSHFLGHINILGSTELFWPWTWGPRHEIYSQMDLTNAEALRFARKHGALAGYVHPVEVEDVMSEKGMKALPRALVADYVLGEADILEVACLWSDEISTSDLWHKFLNLGIPVQLSAGSDVMSDYYRTMAIGATRVYVKTEAPLSIPNYLKGLKQGRSFVSNGPLIEFKVDGREPGEIVNSNSKKVSWTLDVHSVAPYENVELFVNGKIIWQKKSSNKSKSTQYKGTIDMPSGGWVTVRVHGGETQWPHMDSYPFAESGPIWFNKVGSTEKTSKLKAAKDLRKILEVSNKTLIDAYGETSIPKLKSHFNEAKVKLSSIIQEIENTSKN